MRRLWGYIINLRENFDEWSSPLFMDNHSIYAAKLAEHSNCTNGLLTRFLVINVAFVQVLMLT